MNRTLFMAAFVVLLVATFASGWVHGELVNRWGQMDALQLAAGRLGRELPPRLGPWRLVNALEVAKEDIEVLRIAGHLRGIYTNDQTGDTVELAVLAGPSGPLSVHNPEICFSAADYELAGKRKKWLVTDERSQTHSLWQIHANSRHSTRPNLRVLFGWSRGDAWEAVPGPRFALAGLPVLYKLQLAGPVRDEKSSAQYDPCEEFLSRFLAHLQPRLVPSSRHPSPPSRVSRQEPSS